LLEAVARELLVKTQQAGNILAGAVVIIGGAVTACSFESCVRVVNKCIHQSKIWSIVTPARDNTYFK
jgi:hypothetical protein